MSAHIKMERGSDEVLGRRHKKKEVGKSVGIDFGYELKRSNDIAEIYSSWLKRLKSEKDDLEGKLDEKKEEVRRLKENLATMQSDADKSEEIKQRQEKKIAELNEEIVDLKDKIKFKDEEIENLKRTPVQPTKPPKSKKEKDLEKDVINTSELERLKQEREKVDDKTESDRIERAKVIDQIENHEMTKNKQTK